MKFSLDQENAIELARKFDINLSFNNNQPGVTITNSEGTTDFDLDDFFPELETMESKFVTRDKDVFLAEAPVKHQPKKVLVTDSQQSITISSSKMLTGAA